MSPRARHVRLMVTREGRLVVVVPSRFDRRAVPTILESKRAWIERARAQIEARWSAGHSAAGPPDRILLPAVGEEWTVEYRARPAAPKDGTRPVVARDYPGRRLVVTASAANEDACRQALLRWLHRRARTALVPRLDQLSVVHGLRFRRVTIRHQQTRWASCSPRKTISLNLRLLFLDPALVDHILLHELCHTQEMNHSKRFWALLQGHDPDWKAHRLQAREAWRLLPLWLEVRGAPQL